VDAPRTNLPVRLTSFIGRAQEMQEVRDLLESSRMVTVTGAGGCGKTRLAYEVASRALPEFADGVWVAELAPVASGDLVIGALASAVRAPEPRSHSDEDRRASLVEHLGSRRALLVLDNCEHLLGACADIAASILTSCEHVKILATSREPVHLDGEVAWLVPSLAVPEADASPDEIGACDAVRLFVDRACQADASFRQDSADVPAIAEVCRRLDGIPLAIELAAARTRALSPSEIAARLDDVFRLLEKKGPIRRHETIWAAIDWSYQLLPEAERTFFRALSVLAGGFTLEAASAVCAGGHDALDIVSALVDRSLVLAERRDHGTRYRLLEPIREFAARKLEETGEGADASRRHLGFFLGLTERMGAQIFGAEQGKAFVVLRSEQDNVRRAIEWGRTNDPVAAVRLVSVAMPYWATAGERREGRRWLEFIAALPDDAAEPGILAKALNWMALLLTKQGELTESSSLTRRAMALAERAGDHAAMASALREHAWPLVLQGEYTPARSLLESAIAEAELADDKNVQAFSRQLLAVVATYEGRLDEARSHYESSVAGFAEVGDRHRGTAALLGVGALDAYEGNAEGALAKYEITLGVARASGCGQCTSICSLLFGLEARGRNDVASAARWYADALAICAGQDMLIFIPSCLEGISALASDLGRFQPAARVLAAAEALRDALGMCRPTIVASVFAETSLGQDGFDGLLRLLEQQLGQQRFRIGWESGRRLPRRAAFDEALALAEELAAPAAAPVEAASSAWYRERYEPLETIGSGGQGEVVRALDHQHDRPVVLKIRPVGDETERRALLSEARILLGLRPHPGLPLVRDDFFSDDRYVIVMDWVQGTDLRALLEQKGDPGLPVGSVLGYLTEVAEALDHLHSHQPPILHGDVKPANIILTPEGRAVLVDFGIASDTGERVAGSGTRGFIAPEVAGGKKASAAADIFGLAATAFALLTGESPEDEWPDWEGMAPAQARALGRAIRLGMSVDPARRPARARDLIERLRSWSEAALPTGTVTFLFTDIEGSTPLWDAHPEAMPRVIARHEQIVAGAVENAGGRFVKSRGEGDSTLSVFTRASDAAFAAVAMQRALAGERWPEGIEVLVRAGLHTGDAELREGDYFGPTLNRAARIRSLAIGGQVLLSQATAQLITDALPKDTTLIDRGSHELKGLSRAEQIFELSWARETQDHAKGPKQNIGFCRTRDDVNIAYATLGDGSPLVYVCGWPEHLELEWETPFTRAFLTRLAGSSTLIRYDMRGSGLSDRDVDDLSLDALVLDLEAVVHHLGLDRFPLLSLGMLAGPVAIAFAARHRERITHLVLAGGFVRGADVMAADRRDALIDYVERFGFPHFEYIDNPAIGIDEQRAISALQRQGSTPAVQAALLREMFASDVSALLAKLGCPTLILHDREDTIVPFACGRHLATLLPEAQFVTYTGSKASAWVAADALIPAVERFLAGK
jgi:predicted ATPase/class 3 adenylate cyclase/pimeloyl-ACP methyl ester carboxylesterase/tRNA A-37 threonylcarbamoyl transferase component Bud32